MPGAPGGFGQPSCLNLENSPDVAMVIPEMTISPGIVLVPNARAFAKSQALAEILGEKQLVHARAAAEAAAHQVQH